MSKSITFRDCFKQYKEKPNLISSKQNLDKALVNLMQRAVSTLRAKGKKDLNADDIEPILLHIIFYELADELFFGDRQMKKIQDYVENDLEVIVSKITKAQSLTYPFVLMGAKTEPDTQNLSRSCVFYRYGHPQRVHLKIVHDEREEKMPISDIITEHYNEASGEEREYLKKIKEKLDNFAWPIKGSTIIAEDLAIDQLIRNCSEGPCPELVPQLYGYKLLHKALLNVKHLKPTIEAQIELEEKLDNFVTYTYKSRGRETGKTVEKAVDEVKQLSQDYFTDMYNLFLDPTRNQELKQKAQNFEKQAKDKLEAVTDLVDWHQNPLGDRILGKVFLALSIIPSLFTILIAQLAYSKKTTGRYSVFDDIPISHGKLLMGMDAVSQVAKETKKVLNKVIMEV